MTTAVCTGVVLASAVSLSAPPRAASNETQVPPRPNILLITIDTVRADHLSAYGYGRRTSPALEKLAARGVRFEHAISQAPWTLPSTASLLTSLYPSEHGAISAKSRLSAEVDTLAEALQDLGYFTVGIVTHTFVDREHGLAQGFDRFDESQIKGHRAVTSEELTRLATSYITKAASRQPFFLWVHYFDPHFPYVRHPEFEYASAYTGKLPTSVSRTTLEDAIRESKSRRLADSDIEYVKAVYDEELAHTDYWLGQLRSHLVSAGLDESTVVILTADHGEYFMDRGKWFHGKDVFEPLIHVPLVISGAIPDRLRGRVVERSVEISSVPRTVMRLVGGGGSPFGGEDLLALADRDPGPHRPVFAEGSHAWGQRHRKVAVIQSGWKLIHDLDTGIYHLYHLETDPGESTNLWSDEREDVAAMREPLKAALSGFPPRRKFAAPGVDLDTDTIEHLRSLGYVQ